MCMSLSTTDLEAIRHIVKEEVTAQVRPVYNDVKEIYTILTKNNIVVV